MRPGSSASSSQVAQGETLVSTAFLDRPPTGRQATQAELWGLLPLSGPADDEWDHAAFMLPDGEDEEEEEDEEGEEGPAINEGVVLSNLSDVSIKSVAVGSGHVVFLAEGGYALAYGRNHRGQLGVGDATVREAPEHVVFTGCLAPATETHAVSRRLPWSPILTGTSEFPEDPESEQLSPLTDASWAISAVACGSNHTLFLARRSSGAAQVFACGAWEALGLEGVTEDQPFALGHGQLLGVAAIAARRDASCCAAPAQALEGGRDGKARDHLLYFWGEVSCCVVPSYYAEPTPLYRVPARVEALGLGGCFGLALDGAGAVCAWGDGTYGELGGAGAAPLDVPRGLGELRPPAELPVPGYVQLPVEEEEEEEERQPLSPMDSLLRESSVPEPAENSSSAGAFSAERCPRIVDIACGERHSLLLDERGRVFAFGENLAGQCGVPEVVGAGHVTGGTVPKPRLVPMEGPRRCGAGGRYGPPRPYELGARVFAGCRHSAMVTRDQRLYIWGHPANRKLGHAGFNPDGTEAGEAPSKKRPPGVAVRSALRDAVRRPRFVYALLHRRVRALGLGQECTVIVTGDGAGSLPEGELGQEEPLPGPPPDPAAGGQHCVLSVGSPALAEGKTSL